MSTTKAPPSLKGIGINCTKPHLISKFGHAAKKYLPDLTLIVYPNSGEEWHANQSDGWSGKDGEWVGTPVRVERSVNDLVIVDNALNDSMLSPQIKKKINQADKKHAREDSSNLDNKEKDVTENMVENNDSEMQEEIRTNDPVEDVTENDPDCKTN